MFNKFTFIWDLANNHIGSVDHGIQIIKEVGEVCKPYKDMFNFIFKFQYRDIMGSFIHPDYKDRLDIKYVKRFQESYLTEGQFAVLKKVIEDMGFMTACTPFDEPSVDVIEKQNFDFIKIASVSCADFPLLERVAKVDKPIIISTASVDLKDIDRVVEFFRNRNKDIALMHCRAIYPALEEDLELNQIDLLQERYPLLDIGFSSHELPLSTISNMMVVAKGATIFECHIDIDCDTRNAYSKCKNNIDEILFMTKMAIKMNGVKDQRYKRSLKEDTDLMQFKRGMFVNKDLKKGTKLTKEDIFFAFPITEHQLSANDWSKYIDYTLLNDIKKNEPIFVSDVQIFDRQTLIQNAYEKVKSLLVKSNVAIPENFQMELSTHYGLEKFYETGAAIITLYNNEYAKKLLVVLPDQSHPLHYHVKKKESFFVLYGDLELNVNTLDKNEILKLKKGDHYTLERGEAHSFKSVNGCVFEEVSTQQMENDSFYEDLEITNNKDRKTKINFSHKRE
jgi:sialic acid synthase SpsE/mannose-6-phosphate isomerase-like protein (cupin superfamily)